MPTFNTPRFALQTGSAGASPSAGYPLAKYIAGKVRYAAITYALTGTEAASDIINLVQLKEGAVVIPSLSRVVCEDPGTALTIDIGFASNDDALSDGLVLTTPHDLAFTAGGTAVAAQYVPAPLAYADRVIFATVRTATVLTAGAKLLFLVAFVDE